MKRTILGVLVALGALSLGTAASACPSAVPHPTLPGETDAQLAARGKRMHQDALRTRADSVFLAQVSAARMIGRLDAEYTLTPFFALYQTPQPDAPVVMNDSPLVTACEVEPDLGRVYVVYAERRETGWRVIEIVRHADFQDSPPAAPGARDVARGFYQLPTYPEPTR